MKCEQSVDQQSDDLTAKTHRAILITWLVIGLGLALSWAIAVYIIETEVVKELLSLRVSIEGLADGRLDQAIPYLDQTNEIGAISRALSTLRGVAREREIQHWVKAEVSGTVERLQSAEDFAAFSNRLFSCLSQSIRPALRSSLCRRRESHAFELVSAALRSIIQNRPWSLLWEKDSLVRLQSNVGLWCSPQTRGSTLCFDRDGNGHAAYSAVYAGGQPGCCDRGARAWRRFHRYPNASRPCSMRCCLFWPRT